MVGSGGKRRLLPDEPAARGFRRALVALAENDTASYEELSARWARALLDFGSETADNENCAAHIEYGPVADEQERGTTWNAALRVRGTNLPVSAVLHTLEGGRIPASVRRAWPDLKKPEWDAVTRLTTMVFLALERGVAAPRDRARGRRQPGEAYQRPTRMVVAAVGDGLGAEDDLRYRGV